MSNEVPTPSRPDEQRAFPSPAFGPQRPTKLIREAVSVCRTLGWRFFLPIAAFTLPYMLANSFIADELMGQDPRFDPTTPSGVWTAIDRNPSDLAWYGARLVVGSAVTGFFTGVVARATVAVVLGAAPRRRDSFAFAVRRFGPLVWIALLGAAATDIGSIFFLVPGMILLVMFSTSLPAAVVENARGTGALRRSWSLVRGKFWHTAGTVLLTFPFIFPLGLLLVFIEAWWARGLLMGVGSALLTALLAAVTTLLYLELRARKEGLSREALSAEIAAG